MLERAPLIDARYPRHRTRIGEKISGTCTLTERDVDLIDACSLVVLGTERDFVQLPSSTLDRSDATCPRTASSCSWLIYSNKVKAKFVRCLDVPVPWSMGSKAAIARFTGDESAPEC